MRTGGEAAAATSRREGRAGTSAGGGGASLACRSANEDLEDRILVALRWTSGEKMWLSAWLGAEGRSCPCVGSDDRASRSR